MYQIYPASNKSNQIVGAPSDSIEFHTHLNWYKGGLIVAGCDGRVRVSFFKALRHNVLRLSIDVHISQYYKKCVKDWVEQWNITMDSAVTSTMCYNMEVLLIANNDRHWMKLAVDDSDGAPKFDSITEFDS